MRKVAYFALSSYFSRFALESIGRIRKASPLSKTITDELQRIPIYVTSLRAVATSLPTTGARDL